MSHISLILSSYCPVMRLGLRTLLEAVQHIDIIGEVHDVTQLLSMVTMLNPQLLLLDIDANDQRYEDVKCHICSLTHVTQIVAFCDQQDEAFVLELLECGVVGCITKDEALNTILTAIDSVISEGGWLSPHIAAKVARQALHRHTKQQPLFTPREMMVMQCLAAGHTDQDISNHLQISGRTVRYHLQNIYAKLGVDRRGQAIAHIVREGLV